jgi:hypothetical protein
MYSTADIMLAVDNTCYGGKVYLPADTYHLAGCGQDENASANGCPVLQRDPTHNQRQLQTWGGIQIVGEGAQQTDPEIVGRLPGYTWLVHDEGRAGDYASADTDRDGSGAKLGRWPLLSGMGRYERVCETSTGTTPCALRAEADTEGKVGYSKYGRAGTFLGSYDASSHTLCLDDPVASGVCSHNRLVRCTSNDARGGVETGGCGGYGTCEGIATAVETDLAAGEEISGFVKFGSCSYGDTGTACGASWATVLMRVESVGSTCESTGRLVNFRALDLSTRTSWSLPFGHFDVSEQYGESFHIVDMEEFNHETGGFTHLSVMPAHWEGRNSANDSADCYGDRSCTAASTPWACCTGKQAGSCAGEEAGCDGGEAIAFGAAYKGGYDNVSVWYSGGSRAYSGVDGVPGAIEGHLQRSLYSRGEREMADASGWIFKDNTWRDSQCGGTPCIKVGFTPNFVMEGDRFIDIHSGTSLIAWEKARLTILRNLKFYGTSGNNGLFRCDYGCGNTLIDGIWGYGNRGSLVTISPQDNYTVWNFVLRNVFLTAHQIDRISPWMYGAIVFTDYDGNATYDTGDVKGASFDEIHVEDWGNDSCLLALGGGTGDESDAQDGQGRNIDDIRHTISLTNSSLDHFGSGVAYGVCLGNASAGEHEADERLGDWHDSVGGMPRLENNWVNGVRQPDWPGTEAADNTNGGLFDCDLLPQGYRVNGALEGGGAITSCCECDGAGTWSGC